MLTITVTIRMASYPNDPSVGLTGTCLPKDTAGSQRKHETHTGGERKCTLRCLYFCLFIRSRESERMIVHTIESGK